MWPKATTTKTAYAVHGRKPSKKELVHLGQRQSFSNTLNILKNKEGVLKTPRLDKESLFLIKKPRSVEGIFFCKVCKGRVGQKVFQKFSRKGISTKSGKDRAV